MWNLLRTQIVQIQYDVVHLLSRNFPILTRIYDFTTISYVLYRIYQYYIVYTLTSTHTCQLVLTSNSQNYQIVILNTYQFFLILCRAIENQQLNCLNFSVYIRILISNMRATKKTLKEISILSRLIPICKKIHKTVYFKPKLNILKFLQNNFTQS